MAIGYALVKCNKRGCVDYAPVLDEHAKHKILEVGGEFFCEGNDAEKACRHYNYSGLSASDTYLPQPAINGVFVRQRLGHSMIFVPSPQKKRFANTIKKGK